LKAEEYFLDTSIVVYAAGKPSEHKEPCLNVLQNVKTRKMSVALDTEVVQEILYRYHRLGLHREAVKLAWYMLRLKPRILAVSQKDIESSLHLYSKYSPQGIPPRDTIHVATMLNNGIRKIITTDKHFGDVITEVERIDPKTIT
jgi:predicted nucleic acid-binding protein